MNADIFDEIAREVHDSGDVLTVDMARLKEATGAGRLGKWIREGIVDELRKRGLNVAGEMPEGQGARVRIYRQGTPAAKLIEAILQPSREGDEAIRRSAESESAKILDQIRRLVCE